MKINQKRRRNTSPVRSVRQIQRNCFCTLRIYLRDWAQCLPSLPCLVRNILLFMSRRCSRLVEESKHKRLPSFLLQLTAALKGHSAEPTHQFTWSSCHWENVLVRKNSFYAVLCGSAGTISVWEKSSWFPRHVHLTSCDPEMLILYVSLGNIVLTVCYM